MCLALVAIKSWVFFVLHTRPLNCCQKKNTRCEIEFPKLSSKQKKNLEALPIFQTWQQNNRNNIQQWLLPYHLNLN